MAQARSKLDCGAASEPLTGLEHGIGRCPEMLICTTVCVILLNRNGAIEPYRIGSGSLSLGGSLLQQVVLAREALVIVRSALMEVPGSPVKWSSCSVANLQGNRPSRNAGRNFFAAAGDRTR